VTLGDGVKLGYGVKLGDWVTLGDGVKLGDRVRSDGLNAEFRNVFTKAGESHIFVKWVTPDRKSPNFDGGTVLEYPRGAIIEAPSAVISDQQCDVGLHVLRPGYRPEYVGLCSAEHDFIPLRVRVRSEDICFAGLPTMDAKLRVKRLEVLE